MRLYTSLSKLKYLDTSYSFKYLFIAFLGIHIPLIGIVVYALASGFKTFQPSTVIWCTLFFTLIACALTLWMQNALAKPIIITKDALNDYLNYKTLPTLPTDFKDEVGVLMNNTSITLNELDILFNEKRDFIYLLSHDLKTPLHNVMTLLQLMQEDHSNESKDEYLYLLKQASRQQMHLINTVLNLATSEFANLANLQLVHLEPIMNRIIKDQSISLKAKGIRALLDVPYDMQATVNEDLFSMALTNLISNAVKFSTPDSEILVRAVITNNELMIRVIDYGIGFEVNRAPTFEPFAKSSRPGTAGETSNGLGLYFAKKIIDYHKGSLIAESDGEGMGAKFIIRLPK
jgi:signal transduction histidine kinase